MVDNSELKKRHTILIADRNPHVRNYLKREFMSEGYNVCLAKTGQEVLTIIFSREKIDSLILDLDLPDIEGATILDKISFNHHIAISRKSPIIRHGHISFDNRNIHQDK